jgi:hypothetical protein
MAQKIYSEANHPMTSGPFQNAGKGLHQATSTTATGVSETNFSEQGGVPVAVPTPPFRSPAVVLAEQPLPARWRRVGRL